MEHEKLNRYIRFCSYAHRQNFLNKQLIHAIKKLLKLTGYILSGGKLNFKNTVAFANAQKEIDQFLSQFYNFNSSGMNSWKILIPKRPLSAVELTYIDETFNSIQEKHFPTKNHHFILGSKYAK